MSSDTLRTVFTYVIALVVILGGGALLIIPTQLDADTLLPFLTGAIGTTLGYVFGERAYTSASNSQPTITTTSGPPATTTVSNNVDPARASFDGDPYENVR